MESQGACPGCTTFILEATRTILIMFNVLVISGGGGGGGSGCGGGGVGGSRPLFLKELLTFCSNMLL